MSRLVISCYRPYPGQSAALRALVREHLPLLRAEGLATARAPVVMEAADGTIIEVFEWASADAIAAAHANAAVQALWTRFAAVGEYLPIGQVPEAGHLFSEFTPLDV